MKYIKEFITESKNISEWDFIEIYNFLEKQKLPTNLKSEESIAIYNPKEGYGGKMSPYSIHIGCRKQPTYSRAMAASSNFDNEYVYLEVSDKFEPGMDHKIIFNELMKSDLWEATNGQHSQWGTYKFAIKTEDDLEFVYKLLKKHIHKI